MTDGCCRGEFSRWQIVVSASLNSLYMYTSSRHPCLPSLFSSTKKMSTNGIGGIVDHIWGLAPILVRRPRTISSSARAVQARAKFWPRFPTSGGMHLYPYQNECVCLRSASATNCASHNTVSARTSSSFKIYIWYSHSYAQITACQVLCLMVP